MFRVKYIFAHKLFGVRSSWSLRNNKRYRSNCTLQCDRVLHQYCSRTREQFVERIQSSAIGYIQDLATMREQKAYTLFARES